MPIHNLSASKYYALTQKIIPVKRELQVQYEICIGQLITRYDIRNKTVMSIGSSIGNEERFFSNTKCNLVLVDIDESKGIGSLLMNRPEVNENNAGLTFIIEDVKEVVRKDTKLSPIDIIYISSLTLDIIGKDDRYKAGSDFFVPVYKDLVTKYLKEDGLFIQQLYGSSVAPPVEYLVEALGRLGLTALDMYCFDISPGIMLLVGVKANKDRAKELYKEYKTRPDITRFHGRAYFGYHKPEDIPKLVGVKKIYSLE